MCKQGVRELRQQAYQSLCGDFDEHRANWSMIAFDPDNRCNTRKCIVSANEDKRRFPMSYNNFQLPRINGGPYILCCRIGGSFANARLFAQTVFLGRAEIYHP